MSEVNQREALYIQKSTLKNAGPHFLFKVDYPNVLRKALTPETRFTLQRLKEQAVQEYESNGSLVVAETLDRKIFDINFPNTNPTSKRNQKSQKYDS